MRENDYNKTYDDLHVHEDAFRPAQARSVTAANSFLNKVYGWMFIALALTGSTAWYVAGHPDLVRMASRWMLLFCLLELGLVIGLTAAIRVLPLAAALLGFFAYSVLNGVTMSLILLVYTSESVAAAFFAASLTFGITGLIGWLIKIDLSAMGRMLMMALIGLIITTVINMFVASSGLHFLICVAGVLIFAALTAYDTQKIKMLAMTLDTRSSAGKLAVLGALTLYLDFINLFLYLLQLFGRRR